MDFYATPIWQKFKQVHEVIRSDTLRQLYKKNTILTYKVILLSFTVEPCILEQIDYLWGLAVAKPII